MAKQTKPKRKRVAVEDTPTTRSQWVVPIGICIVFTREVKPSREDIANLIGSWKLPKDTRLEDMVVDPAYREVL